MLSEVLFRQPEVLLGSQGLSSRIYFIWRGGGGDSDKVLCKAGCNGPKVAHNAGRSTLVDC